jgi:hypothetical protein
MNDASTRLDRLRVGLVGCVKTKLDRPAPARDLYVSPLFRGRRRWVERTCDRWFILSAAHGLVDPSDVLEPYDLALTSASSAERTKWARGVMRSLEQVLGDLNKVAFEIHAGAAYRSHGLEAGLVAMGATTEVPAAGLSQGAQLAFYSGSSPSHSLRATDETSSQSASHGYGCIGDALRSEGVDRTLAFAEIERIIGRRLPASAARHRAWWANDRTHSHALGWLEAGFRVSAVDLTARLVSFRRSS